MSPKRPALNHADRLLFVWLSRLVPTTLAVLAVVSPETVIRWHRAGFGACPYHKSNPDILMMQSTKDGQWLDASDCVHRASSWRVFRQR